MVLWYDFSLLVKLLDFDGLAVMQQIMTEGTKTKKLASKLGTHKGPIQNKF